MRPRSREEDPALPEILAMRASGKTYAEISKTLKLSYTRTWNLANIDKARAHGILRNFRAKEAESRFSAAVLEEKKVQARHHQGE